jgi:hypothetical protein
MLDDALKKWAKICPGGILLYEYYFKWAWLNAPFPIIHKLKKDYPYFHKKNVIGVYSQWTEKNMWTLGLNYYIAGRLLWNANANVNAILDEFYRKFYGSAYKEMKKYYELFEKSAEDSNCYISSNSPYYEILEIFDDETLMEAGEILSEARKKAQSYVVIQRIAKMTLSYNYLVKLTDYLKSCRKALNDIEGEKWAFDMPFELMNDITIKRDAFVNFLQRYKNEEVFVYPLSYLTSCLKIENILKPDRWSIMGKCVKNNFHVKSRKWYDFFSSYSTPEYFDLWLYGYDWDSDGEKSEHDIYKKQ